MPGLSDTSEAARAYQISSVMIKSTTPRLEAIIPPCDMIVPRKFLSAIFDPARRQLPIRDPLKFVERPKQSVSTLVCSGKSSAEATLNGTAPEYRLREGIFVQAGPECPAKPLLQETGLRVCHGTAGQVGLRYSGMSVMYGTATGHVLAVVDTTAALKMAPLGGHCSLRSATSLYGLDSGDLDSPLAVSAGVSTATSTSLSPVLSRANSSSTTEAAAVDTMGWLTMCSPTAPRSSAPFVMSGRSIKAAPIIQVATAVNDNLSGHAMLTPTSPSVPVYVSFALLGFKHAGGRVGTVQCCRIMPATTPLLAASGTDMGCASLGLVMQMEVVGGAEGTLQLFMEGAQVTESCKDSGQCDSSWEDDSALGPVHSVTVQGQVARWRYSRASGILSVEVPSAASACRKVAVFL